MVKFGQNHKTGEVHNFRVELYFGVKYLIKIKLIIKILLTRDKLDISIRLKSDLSNVVYWLGNSFQIS